MEIYKAVKSMISKISKCRIIDKQEECEQYADQVVHRVVTIHHRPALQPQIIQQNKKQLKALLVLSLLTKFLQHTQSQQQKLRQTTNTQHQQVNTDIDDPFIKKYMQRTHQSRKVISCYYAAITPVALPVRSMREMAMVCRTIVKRIKMWIVVDRRPQNTKRMLQKFSLKRLSGEIRTNPRISVEFSINESGALVPTKKHFSQPQTAPLFNKPVLVFSGSHSLHTAQKLLQADLYQFQNLNKGVNSITHHNSTYEFVAVKYLIGSALANSAVLKSDLLELETYETNLNEKERVTLIDLLKRVAASVSSISQILVAHIKKLPERAGWLRQPHNSPQRLSVYPQSKIRSHTDQFSKLYKQFVDNSQRFFSQQCQRHPISNKTYRQLLQLATRARYGMMYIHREMLETIRKAKEGYIQQQQPRARSEINSRYNTQMRILTDKYNITGKRGKENVFEKPNGYYSEHISPRKNKNIPNRFSNSEAKRLIKMFRNGEFNLNK